MLRIFKLGRRIKSHESTKPASALAQNRAEPKISFTKDDGTVVYLTVRAEFDEDTPFDSKKYLREKMKAQKPGTLPAQLTVKSGHSKLMQASVQGESERTVLFTEKIFEILSLTSSERYCFLVEHDETSKIILALLQTKHEGIGLQIARRLFTDIRLGFRNKTPSELTALYCTTYYNPRDIIYQLAQVSPQVATFIAAELLEILGSDNLHKLYINDRQLFNIDAYEKTEVLFRTLISMDIPEEQAVILHEPISCIKRAKANVNKGDIELMAEQVLENLTL